MKRAVAILGLILSAAAVVWLGAQLDLERAWAALRGARPELIGLAAVLYTSLFVLRGLRWSRLLKPVAPVSIPSATEVFLIGFVANNVLPARLGDVARGIVLARQAALPTVASLSSVVLERIFDGLTVVFFLSVALEAAPPSADWVRSFQTMAATAFTLALALCVAIAVARTQTLAIAHRMLTFLPVRMRFALQSLLTRIADGLMSLSSRRLFAEVCFLSLVIWSVEVLVYIVIAKAFGFSVPAFGLVVVMAVLTLGLTAPSAPAFVGVFEGLIVSAIGLYGISGSEALAFAVVLHAVHFLPGSILGLWAATKSGIELSSIPSSPEPTKRNNSVGAHAR